MNYRESQVLTKIVDSEIERELFNNDLFDGGIVPLVVGNEFRGARRLLNFKRE